MNWGEKKCQITIIIVTISTFLLGMLFFAVYNEWIIFSYPSYKKEVGQQIDSMKMDKKDVWLLYWDKKKWKKEKINLLWTDDPAKNIQYLVSSWLTLLDQEHVMRKKVSLQTVLISSSGVQAYLSFDRVPFSSEASTYEKLMWIEGILKTIRENDIELQKVMFLVHHQVLQDYHLDFSNPWPIYGFLASQG